MNEEYAEYFRRLWEEELSVLVFMLTFKPILEEQEKNLEVKLRFDAKCFLFLNFKYMICEALPNYEEEDLREDIDTILRYARKKIKEENQKISAFMILKAVLKSWKKLKFPKLWG